MDFVVIQRISDKKFTTSEMGVFEDDIRLAAMYSNENQAQCLADILCGLDIHVEVMYVTITLSNVKG